MDTHAHDDAIQQLGGKIGGISTVLLTTLDEDGSLRTRPMVALDVPFTGTLWFFTHADAPKVGDVEHAQQVSVAYVHPEEHRFVVMTGTAQVVKDASKMRELWRPNLAAWFPRQLAEPDLALLRVQVTDAEYWDGSVGTILRLAKTSAPDQVTEQGENQKLRLE